MLSDIKLTAKQTVMSLVESAGMDVSDWAVFKSGTLLDRASRNPKYCYQWAFIQPGQFAVLCLWLSEMEEINGVVVRNHNYRSRAYKSGKNAVWKSRGLESDAIVQTAYLEGLPIKAIICDGYIRNADDPQSEPSKPKLRQLDSVSWAVTSYNLDSGECTIKRGAAPIGLSDQFSIPESRSPPKRQSNAEVYVRSKQVRDRVLMRSGGKCERCSEFGFLTSDNKYYLETHHAIPLSEGGADTEKNVIALCPGDHRRAHYASDRQEIRAELLNLLSSF